MSVTKLQILIDTGTPRELRKPEPEVCPRRPIEDQVRESLELIESGHESSIEWRAIQGLYEQLTKMKQTPRIRNLRDMIRPVLSKYGYHKD